MQCPQIPADDLYDNQPPPPCADCYQRDADLKLGRQLPQPNQRSDLLPQQKLQALKIKVLRERSIIHCVVDKNSGHL
jgi:hypothetical protein